MESPYDAARKALPRLGVEWDAWESLIATWTEVDELSRKMGQSIIENMKIDAMIGADGMRSLMETVLLNANTSMLTLEDAQSGYRDACHAHQRLGGEAKSVSGILWHVTTDDELRACVNISNSLTKEQFTSVWIGFRDACLNKDAATAERYLPSGLRLNSNGHQVFATFPMAGGAGGGDPDRWDATTACDALGLSKSWPAYRPGQELWMLRYRYSYDLRELKVPTIADAALNPLFMPTESSANVDYGWTRPLGALALAPRGMPEVVHEPAALAIGDNRSTHSLNLDLDGVPTYLGEIKL